MKQIIFLFVFLWSLNATAQIDVNRFTLTSDTTIASIDTVYWNFSKVEVPRNLKPISLYQADLVTYRGGARTVNLTSGILTVKDYALYLRDQRDRLNNELITLQKAALGLQAQRAAIIAELISLQNR